MKLIRMALLYFHTKENDWLRYKWVVKLGEVEVASQRIGNAPEIKDQQRQLVFASVKLEKLPEKNSDGFLILSEGERRKAELAIEAVANMFSIAERCRRRISSPSPCVALLPENDDEIEMLETSPGILAERNSIPDVRFKLNLDNVLVSSLSDRMDGVALLAEALANTHATGKYHEFVRLYELAFSRPFTQLEKKLSNFLIGANLGYTRIEIKQWIKFRHPSTHADFQKSNDLVLEADIVRYISRMEQAAYDLLLNKGIWHSSDAGRRNVWIPDVATISDKHDIQAVQGKSGVFQFQIFDEFNAYPLDLNGGLSSLPEGFWSKWKRKIVDSAGEANLTVTPRSSLNLLDN